MTAPQKAVYVNTARQRFTAASWDELRRTLATMGMRIAPHARQSESPDAFHIDGTQPLVAGRDKEGALL